MPARPAAVSAAATAGSGPHRVVTPYNSGEQPYVIRYVWMGNRMEPVNAEAVYNDYTANSLLGQIMATPDVMGPGAGAHVIAHGPRIGSVYPGYTNEDLIDRPVSITYTVTGAGFAVYQPGPDEDTISYPSTFSASGMESDIYDQIQGVYLDPETGATSLTVTAQTENDQVTAPDGVITALTPVQATLTMPVSTPDYPDPEFLTSETNLLEEGSSEAGAQGQPLGGQDVSSGINWATLQATGATATEPYPTQIGSIDIKFKTYTVNTVTNVQITIQEPLPLAQQPADTGKYVTIDCCATNASCGQSGTWETRLDPERDDALVAQQSISSAGTSATIATGRRSGW